MQTIIKVWIYCNVNNFFTACTITHFNIREMQAKPGRLIGRATDDFHMRRRLLGSFFTLGLILMMTVYVGLTEVLHDTDSSYNFHPTFTCNHYLRILGEQIVTRPLVQNVKWAVCSQ